jgi:phospholipid-translocating ATPase
MFHADERVGYIVTYIAPLAFVLAVTMGKEAYDDYQRYLRDREANSTRYLVLLPQEPTPASSPTLHHAETPGGQPSKHHLPRPQTRSTPSAQIKVGDMVLLEKNQRVPADMALLVTSEEEGTCFIRTDQLDGETDWKLKVAVGETQKMGEAGVGAAEGSLYGEQHSLPSGHGMLAEQLKSRSADQGHPRVLRRTHPHVHCTWPADVKLGPSQRREHPVGQHCPCRRERSRTGGIHRQGDESRAQHERTGDQDGHARMGGQQDGKGASDRSQWRRKIVLTPVQILCTVTFALSVFLVALNGFRGQWYIYVVRFLILFSSIIPIRQVKGPMIAVLSQPSCQLTLTSP